MDRLVSSGVIIGFTARVRDEADPLAIHAITLIEVEGKTADQVIARLRGFPEVLSMHTTNGRWDLVADVHTESLSAFDAVLGRIRRIDGIANTESSFLLSSVLR
ncbi:Lrp/AsnC family transcriptional regulator [Sinomonas sp. G460-2]|uniref:Lrp/AsnC family transcriptional regulator n=1 Tax=Sinomonas sp. G460-2 TaxID=3393464 RepID=UPI0039EF3282